MKKTVLVTGSTDGIGLETARQLLKRGQKVILHGRSADRLAFAHKQLDPLGEVSTLRADLSSLKDVARMADEVLKLGELDVLLNNAGVLLKARELSADGHELTMAVNHYAHMLLTLKLRPLLAASADGRVVTVSSMVHVRSGLDLADIEISKNWSPYGSYGASKLANAAMAAELPHQDGWARVLSVSLHPGVISTKLLHAGFGPGGAPVDEGARTSVYCSMEQGLMKHQGGYFNDSRPATANPLVSDAQFRAELWERSLGFISKWL